MNKHDLTETTADNKQKTPATPTFLRRISFYYFIKPNFYQPKT